MDVPVIIAIIIGGVLGAAGSGGFGALMGAAMAWLLVRSFRQAREISELQQAVKAWKFSRAASPASVPIVPTVSPATDAMASSAVAEKPAETIADKQAEAVPLVSRWDHAAAPPPAVGTVAGAAPAQRKTAESPVAGTDPLAVLKHWLFGGNTIVKVGVGILFIGLAFLAKFASEHVYVSIEMRLAAIGGSTPGSSESRRHAFSQGRTHGA